MKINYPAKREFYIYNYLAKALFLCSLIQNGLPPIAG